MFWNKKSKESGLPDLPQPSFPIMRNEIPSMHSDILRNNKIPSYNEEKDEESETPERHNLPSFPDSPIKSGFSQTAIKNAIDSEDESNDEYNEETIDSNQNKNFKTIEIESGKIFPSKRLSLPPEKKQSQTPSESFISLDSKAKEVFVKIDKFQSARKSLSSAREKVQEIEDMLKKIRDVRMREDQELTAWEKDIESVKSRIEEISKNIFEKL